MIFCLPDVQTSPVKPVWNLFNCYPSKFCFFFFLNKRGSEWNQRKDCLCQDALSSHDSSLEKQRDFEKLSAVALRQLSPGTLSRFKKFSQAIKDVVQIVYSLLVGQHKSFCLTAVWWLYGWFVFGVLSRN